MKNSQICLKRGYTLNKKEETIEKIEYLLRGFYVLKFEMEKSSHNAGINYCAFFIFILLALFFKRNILFMSCFVFSSLYFLYYSLREVKKFLEQAKEANEILNKVEALTKLL